MNLTGGTPSFPGAARTRNEFKKPKPLVTGRTNAGGAIGKTTKAAGTPNAKSTKEKNHTPIQSTREKFRRRRETINVDSNVKGPSEDGDDITQGKPGVRLGGPPKVGS